jgi:hypothetical protein
MRRGANVLPFCADDDLTGLTETTVPYPANQSVAPRRSKTYVGYPLQPFDFLMQ